MWYGKPTYDRFKPKFDGEEGISSAVNYHFKFIKSQFHNQITEFIKEVSLSITLSSKEVVSWSQIRFRIGEIGFYPKNGNLYLDAPDELMPELSLIAKKYFRFVEVKRINSIDDEPTLIIELTFPFIH